MKQHFNALATQQAEQFFDLFGAMLPADYIEYPDAARYGFAHWLAEFEAISRTRHLSGFDLLSAVRKRAQRYYQSELKHPLHTVQDWAFFRFRLELSLLRTCQADPVALQHCHAYANLLAGFAFRNSTDSTLAPQ